MPISSVQCISLATLIPFELRLNRIFVWLCVRTAAVGRRSETAARGVYVEGLVPCPVTCKEELNLCINGASSLREVRATQMNDESSRSHLVFMV